MTARHPDCADGNCLVYEARGPLHRCQGQCAYAGLRAQHEPPARSKYYVGVEITATRADAYARSRGFDTIDNLLDSNNHTPYNFGRKG